MFDDCCCWSFREFLDELQCTIEVIEVVERNFLTAGIEAGCTPDAWFTCRVSDGVKRCFLMRILAVAEDLLTCCSDPKGGRKLRRSIIGGVLRLKVRGNHRIVGCRMRICLGCQLPTEFQRDATERRQLIDDPGVIRWAYNDCNTVVVFCRAAHHRWATNIDVFDCILNRAAFLGNRRCKRVEVYDDKIDWSDAM